MDTGADQESSYIAEYIIGAGYLLFICLAFSLCSASYYFAYFQPRLTPINTFATSLPPTTAIPHIFPTNQKASEKIIVDNFSNNGYHWEHADAASRTKLENGKLVLESLRENGTALATCDAALCGLGGEPYFLQVDLSTDVATDRDFGVIFNRFIDGDRFFLFQLNIEAKTYRLFRHSSDRWSIRMGGESDLIQAFPAVNTLGIYAGQDTVEFYINGQIVDSYTESRRSFYTEQYAFYVNNSGFKLIVDDLSISDMSK